MTLPGGEDVIAAAVVLVRIGLTPTGATPTYEVRSGRHDDDVMFASEDVDEVLTFMRGFMTGSSDDPNEEGGTA